MASPTIKTPLRYPGGKSKVAKTLVNKFPFEIDEYREPFIGGGSVALEFAQRYPNVPIWINDKYEHLYHFWVNVQSNSENLFDFLVAAKEKNNNEDKARKLFNESKEQIRTEKDSFKRACLFWILNKCSYSGLTENSKFSPTASNQNFTTKNARKILNVSKIIKNWGITNYDYSVLMQKNGTNTFLFLDPPYKIKSNLYGKDGEHHESFSHEQFIEQCKKCNHNWIVTYNNDETLKMGYEGFYLDELKMTYTFQRGKTKELVVSNYKHKSTDTLF